MTNEELLEKLKAFTPNEFIKKLFNDGKYKQAEIEIKDRIMKRYTVYELKTGDSVETFLTEGLALEYTKMLIKEGKYKPTELEIEEREYRPIEDGDMVYCTNARLIWDENSKKLNLEDSDYPLETVEGNDIVFDENDVPNISKD